MSTKKSPNLVADRARSVLHKNMGQLVSIATSLKMLEQFIESIDVDTDISEVEHPILQLLRANYREVLAVSNEIDQQLLDLSHAGVIPAKDAPAQTWSQPEQQFMAMLRSLSHAEREVINLLVAKCASMDARDKAQLAGVRDQLQEA